MHIFFNPNPAGNLVGDCVVRAIAKATNQSWTETFTGLMTAAYHLNDMPSSNHVWASYLKRLGFHKHIIPDSCPDCYTIADFANDHPNGTYVVGTGTHAVAVVDGIYYDTWDSGNEVPICYFSKEG